MTTMQDFYRDPFVILRGALNRDGVRKVHDATLAVLKEIEGLSASTSDDGTVAEITDNYRKQGGFSLTRRYLGKLNALKDARRLFDLVLESQQIADVVRRNLGASYLLKDYTSIRRQDVTFTGFPWHQDTGPLGIGASAYPKLCGMVIWIPLADVDDLTPTVEFLDKPDMPVIEHIGEPVSGYSIIPDDSLSGIDVTRVRKIPNVQAGDVAMFPLTSPHRTFVCPGMTKPRFSCDMRVSNPAYLEYYGERESERLTSHTFGGLVSCAPRARDALRRLRSRLRSLLEKVA